MSAIFLKGVRGILTANAILATSGGLLAGEMEKRKIRNHIKMFQDDDMEPMILHEYKKWKVDSLFDLRCKPNLQAQIVMEKRIQAAGKMLLWPLLM